VTTLTLHEEDRGGEWDALLGQTLGSYRLVRLLGRGGMGAVYLARQPAIGALVAIKVLHPRFCADRAVVERFFNEARAVNLIGHENILKILDFSQTPEGRYYFVMELLEGRPLSALLAQKKPVELSVAGPIALQCCRALQAAHARGIVHRDLKPDNVFLVQQMGRKDFVKLVDFGIAKLGEETGGPERGLTQAGTIIGTPEYMAPEQAAGRTAEVGRRSDVYSLGVVLYELACGRVPFSKESVARTLVAQMEEAPVPPRQLVPAVPEQYQAVILKALAKKREERFSSMQELHAAIAGAMQALGISQELPPADEPPPAVELPPEGTPDAEIQTLSGKPKPVTAPERPKAKEGLDPRFATQPPPATQTSVLGPVEPAVRAARAGDFLLAPGRRGYTFAAALVLGAALLVASWPKAQPKPPARIEVPVTAPRPPEPKPPPPPAPPEDSALRPASPAQLRIAEQEKEQARKARKAQAAQKQQGGPQQQPAPAAPKGAEAKAPKPEPKHARTAAEQALQERGRLEAQAAQKAAQQLREMTAAAEAAAQAEAAQGEKARSAKLFVVSDPPGASVTAAWAGKSASGEAPVVFRVLRGAKVTVTLSLPGRAPAVREVVASQSQAVSARLPAQ
jgi:serine/threonine protein kinase